MLIKSKWVGLSMWTDSDEAVQAFAELLKESQSSFSTFLETVWPEYQKSRSPNLALLFVIGKFQGLFIQRIESVSGEDVRDSLHIVLNDVLQDSSTRTLIERFVSDASNNMGA
tara:strand:- start:364 stop:702 length:339 start_codon:yes stop_codon:yes gene_type:complete